MMYPTESVIHLVSLKIIYEVNEVSKITMPSLLVSLIDVGGGQSPKKINLESRCGETFTLAKQEFINGLKSHCVKCRSFFFFKAPKIVVQDIILIQRRFL